MGNRLNALTRGHLSIVILDSGPQTAEEFCGYLLYSFCPRSHFPLAFAPDNQAEPEDFELNL